MRFDDPRVPIAETCRRVGAEAERMQLPRPSYERVRVLVHALRAVRPPAWHAPLAPGVLLNVAFRVRSPFALLDLIAGIRLPADPRAP